MSKFWYSPCGERNSGTTKFPKLSPSKMLLQKLHKFFSQVFDLTPMFGTLAPFQSQVLNVAFQPQAFMGAVVTAVCTVLGGPTETIRLSGQNARHIYSLSTTFINFGFRVSMSEIDNNKFYLRKNRYCYQMQRKKMYRKTLQIIFEVYIINSTNPKFQEIRTSSMKI